MIRFLKFFTETIAWFQIALSPVLIGVFAGAVIYYFLPDDSGFMLGVSMPFIGLIAGVWWAVWVWKKKGTVTYLSRVIATPELNNEDSSEEFQEAAEQDH